MDASQIIKLMQTQNNRYINRCQTVDSSTLTWKQNQQSSSYIQGVRTCGGGNTVINVPTQPGCANSNGTCNYGGQGKSTTLMSGSTQQFPNVFAGAAGSASRVYSSDNIMLQKASNNICGDTPTNPAPQNSYVITNVCSEYCTDSNYSATVVNNQANPYLPAVDTYYALKNPCVPSIDQNQKHYLLKCNKCPTDTGMTSLESNHTYVIEQPNSVEQPNSGTISYIFPCYDPEQPSYGSLYVGATPVLPTISGSLPLGGSYSIQYVSGISNTSFIVLNTTTGAINSQNIPPDNFNSGTYIITYTVGSFSVSTTQFSVSNYDCNI